MSNRTHAEKDKFIKGIEQELKTLKKQLSEKGENKMEKEKEVVEAVKVEGKRYSRPGVFEKLQNARYELSKLELKKGGRNKFSGYSYYELPDFLGQVNALCVKHRITPVFNLYPEEAELVIHDWDSEQTILFRTDNADATTLKKDGKTPANLEIQTLGSQHTYLKRYLYQNAMEISESDGLEVNTGNEEYVNRNVHEPTVTEVETATGYQVQEVKKLFMQNRINKMLEAYGVEKVEEMKKEDLEKIITIRQKQLKKEADEKIEREKPVEQVAEMTEEEEMEIMRENIGALDDLV